MDKTKTYEALLNRALDSLRAAAYYDRHQYHEADNQYDGSLEMDWDNPKHRLFLVAECGFSCADPDYIYCKSCIAKDKCDTYQEYLAEDGDSE